MQETRVIIVSGLPASGKTVLGRQLAQRYGVPMLSKDAIKDPLLDILGAHDAPSSRLLSNASFAVMFAMARELVACGIDLVLEGNFRPGEHEPAFCSLQAEARACSCRFAQVLCRVDEATRLARLEQRARDGARHPGHRDAQLAATPPNRSGDALLALPGKQVVYAGDCGVLDQWWQETGGEEV